MKLQISRCVKRSLECDGRRTRPQCLLFLRTCKFYRVHQALFNELSIKKYVLFLMIMWDMTLLVSTAASLGVFSKKSWLGRFTSKASGSFARFSRHYCSGSGDLNPWAPVCFVVHIALFLIPINTYLSVYFLLTATFSANLNFLAGAEILKAS